MSSGRIAGSSLSMDWVIAYTTGMPRPRPRLGRGSIRRPATIRPCDLVYGALQRYYVRGLVSGALKTDRRSQGLTGTRKG